MKTLRKMLSKIHSLLLLRDVSISVKLILVFGFINLCVVVLGAFVFVQMGSSQDELDRLLAKFDETAQTLLPASERLIESSYEQLALGEKVNLIYVNVRKTGKLHAKLPGEAVDQAVREPLQRMDGESLGLLIQARDMIDVSKRTVEETAGTFQALKQEIEGFSGVSRLNAVMSRLKIQTLYGIGLILIVSVLAYFILWKRIAFPINDVVTVIMDVSAGKLGGGAVIHSADEFGQMSQAADEMTKKLGSTLQGVVGSFSQVEQVGALLGETADSIEEGTRQEESVVTQLDQAANTISASVDKVIHEMENLMSSATSNLSSLMELSSSVKEVSRIAEEVASSAGESGDSIQEMSASITQVAASAANMTALLIESASSMSQIDQSIQQIRSNTDKSSATAKALFAEASEKGRGAMLRAKNCMDKLRAMVTTLGETVNAVGENSTGIDAMTRLISDVSEQTNLLALNASILAAQAGDRGKGFSVVAEEIRSLSSRTDSSLIEIEKYVRNIQEGIKEAVSQVSRGIDGVKDGVQEVANVEGVLEKIIDGINLTKDLSEDIAGQADAQSKGSTTVAKSLTDLSASAQQLSASMQEQDKAARHILKMAEISSDRTQKVKTATDEQSTNVKGIEKEVEKTVDMSRKLTDISKEARQSLKALAESMTVIQDVLNNNQQRIQALRTSLDLMREHVVDVKGRISVFDLASLEQRAAATRVVPEEHRSAEHVTH